MNEMNIPPFLALPPKPRAPKRDSEGKEIPTKGGNKKKAPAFIADVPEEMQHNFEVIG